jgi:hypothetical protein
MPELQSGDQWPLNPRAESGLGTPPGSSAGPSSSRVEVTPPRPSISGVESSRFPKQLSTGGGSGGLMRNDSVPSPHMRELRRTWGME